VSDAIFNQLFQVPTHHCLSQFLEWRLEPCADIIIGVGGGAPINFSRRRRAAGPKKLAARRPRGRAKEFSFKDSRKILFSPHNFLMTFFSHRQLQQNNYAATMVSAARRQIIGGVAPNNKRRRPQIVGGGTAHGSSDALPSVTSSPGNVRAGMGWHQISIVFIFTVSASTLIWQTLHFWSSGWRGNSIMPPFAARIRQSFPGFLLSISTSRAALGGSSVWTFTTEMHWWNSPSRQSLDCYHPLITLRCGTWGGTYVALHELTFV